MIRTKECSALLALWHEVRLKNYVFDNLSKAAKMEVIDAIVDEEATAEEEPN